MPLRDVIDGKLNPNPSPSVNPDPNPILIILGVIALTIHAQFKLYTLMSDEFRKVGGFTPFPKMTARNKSQDSY